MEKKTKETRIFVRVSEEEKASWQREADARGIKLSKLIRQIVNDSVKSNDR